MTQRQETFKSSLDFKAVKDEKDLGLTMLSVSDNLARAGW